MSIYHYLLKSAIRIHIAIILILSSFIVKSQTQIAICPQQATFSSMVRGYHFTAPCNFTICGLYIPTDASNGLQNVAVVRFTAGPPPAYSSTTNNFVQLLYQPNWPANTMIPCNINVNTGDIIGVYGARDYSMINSYGQPKCMTTILGYSVMLQRSGMQYNLSTQSMHDIWSEVDYDIGRIFMYINCCPTANFTAATPVCSGQPSTITYTGSGTAGVTNFNWSFPGGTPSSATTIGPHNVTWSTAGTYNVSLSVSQASCTTATSTQQVVVNSVPTANAGPDVSICQGESVVLSSTGGNGFIWSNGANTPNITVSPSNTTTYTVTVTGAGGCTNSDDVVVIVNNKPSANAGPDVSICQGESVILNASGGNTYLWSNQSSNASISVSPSITTTYSVTVTSSSNCTASDAVVVTVNPVPAANAGNNVTICNGSSTIINASGGGSYLWNTGGTNASLTVSPASTTTYIVTVYSPNGCSASDDVVVTVNPKPPANAGPDQALCLGASVTLSATGGITYTWNLNPFQPSSQITVSPQQTTTYTVTVIDANGCTASDDVVVSVYTTPPVNAGKDTTTCNGNAVLLTATGGNNYLWNTGQTTASISVTPLVNTTYTVTVSDANGCSGTDDVAVNVNPNPSITVSPHSAVICSGDSLIISASGAINYSWSPPSGLSNTTIANPVSSPLNNTVYIVTGENQYGCTATASINITIEPYPILSVSPASALICSGQSINLTANGATTYNWTPSAGLSSATSHIVIASPVITTTYTLTGTSLNGCSSTINYVIDVMPSPQINFTANTFNGCPPLSVEFNDMSSGNIVTWNWNFGDPVSGASNVSNIPNPIHIYTVPGFYNITLSIVNDSGCSSTFVNTNMINVFSEPIASFYISPSIGNIDLPINFIDQSTNAISWFWNFGEHTSGNENFSNIPSPVHIYSTDGEYEVSLTITDANGCEDSTSNKVIIQDNYTLWAPTAFTPNGDGINEYFIPKGNGIDPDNFTMYIFDRWGKELYFTNSYNQPWKGTIGNSDVIAPQGVYVWVVYTSEKSGIKHKYIGRVTLIL